MTNKKMTMADIAELSGVAKSTVSRYFNGGYVKQATKDKIQKVIEEYNYEPNAFARLKAKKSNVIGVVVPTLNSKITSRVITSIDRYLRDRDYTTLIKNSDHDIDLELQNIQRLMNQNVDGILLGGFWMACRNMESRIRLLPRVITVSLGDRKIPERSWRRQMWMPSSVPQTGLRSDAIRFYNERDSGFRRMFLSRDFAVMMRAVF